MKEFNKNVNSKGTIPQLINSYNMQKRNDRNTK